MMSRSQIFIGLVLFITACLPALDPNQYPTETPIHSETPLPTETILWFPATATHTPFPTPEATPTVEYCTNVGEIIFHDDFSEEGFWILGSTQNRSAAIGVDELTIVISGARTYMSSVREQPVLRDFYLEITAQPNICRGMDEFGLLLRVSSSSDFYRFALSCDGQVRFDRVIDGVASVRQPWILSGSFPPGAPSIARLAIAVKGSEMQLFINDDFQFSVVDPLIDTGGIGVFARSTTDETVSINFSDLTVWEILEQ